MYDKIVKDQAFIAYILHIPIFDTDELCPYDRDMLIESIKEIKDQENKSMNNTDIVY